MNKIKKSPQPTTHNPQRRNGFTLIELLVVIGIITMVMAVLFPNFMGARQNARDTKRKSDLDNIRKALELYKLDQPYQQYPTGPFPASWCGQCWSSQANCAGNIYMHQFPCDPGTLTGTPYLYQPTGTTEYALSACLENAVDPNRDPAPISQCGGSGASYTVYQP